MTEATIKKEFKPAQVYSIGFSFDAEVENKLGSSNVFTKYKPYQPSAASKLPPFCLWWFRVNRV